MFRKILRALGELPEQVRRSFKSTFRSLEDRNFLTYNAGMFVSNCGTWMQNVALSWLVYRLTGSAAALGIVSFANSLPLLLLTFVGGMTADRYDKRKILLVTNSIAMVQAVLLTILVAAGTATIPLVVALSCLLGCVTAFEVPTRQSLVPLLIRDEKDTHNAIGLSSAAFHVSRMIGPALGGFAIASFGEEICFGLNAASFIAALLGLCFITVRMPEPRARANEAVTDAEKAEQKKADNQAFWAIVKRPAVLTLLILAAFVSTFGMQYSVLMPVIVDKLLHGSSEQYGLLSAAGGLGALFGALIIASFGSGGGLRKRIGYAAIVLALALVSLALSQLVLLSVVSIVVAGTCLSMHWSGGNSLMQQCVEPTSRGKLMGVYTTFTLGMAPFTALLSGWMAEHFGVTTALLVASLGMLVGALIYISKVRRLDDSCDQGK